MNQQTLRMRCMVLVLLLGSLCFWSYGALADPRQRFDDFLYNLTTVTADFSQVIYNPDGQPGKPSTGQLWIQRPGKFRWLYLQPYEQLIVLDGATVWVWDKDLEQVTKRPFSAHSGSLPAQLLSGQLDVKASFDISYVGTESGMDWVELTPRTESESFKQVQLGFDPSGLKIMKMADNFGQTSVIEFSRVLSNTKLAPELFTFDPPAGVDVIAEE